MLLLQYYLVLKRLRIKLRMIYSEHQQMFIFLRINNYLQCMHLLKTLKYLFSYLTLNTMYQLKVNTVVL